MGDSGHHTLGETLAKVRSRIEQIRERAERLGEQETKAILIEPVLAALGWHPDEFDEVRHEYRFRPQDNPVDYALLDFGRPCLLIEAKPLGTPLDHHKCATQVLGYASAAGVGWSLLTNGDDYRLYNASAPVPAEEKLFRDVRLSEADQADRCIEMFSLIAKKQISKPGLDALWQSQFVDRHVKVALAELFSGEDSGLSKLVRKRCPELTLSEVRESLRRATINLHFPEVCLRPEPPLTGRRGGKTEPEPTPPPRTAVTLSDLIDAGLIRCPLKLERSYKGVALEATIEQGGLVNYAGASFDSLSTAGGMARKSVSGSPEGLAYPQTNGWTFWQYRDPETGRLRPVDELRQQYLQRQA